MPCTTVGHAVASEQHTLGIGHAPFLARALGYAGAAWNVESACAVTPLALLQACALVDAGHYSTVLVVVSCTYGRHSDHHNPISASVGDAATAFVVRDRPGAPPCVAYTENTHPSIGAVAYEAARTEDGRDTLHIVNRPGGSRLIWSLCIEKLAWLVDRTLEGTGLGRHDVDLYAFNTPLAWYAEFARRALGLPEGAVTNVHPTYANVGPALPGLSLQTSFEQGRPCTGHILVHSIGSVSSAGCILFRDARVRWTDIARL